MARIKLINADRLTGYMKTDSSETNGLKFSKIIDFFDPAITDVLGHESGESRIARYHESARYNTIGDVEKFAGPIAYPRMIMGDHITRICETGHPT